MTRPSTLRRVVSAKPARRLPALLLVVSTLAFGARARAGDDAAAPASPIRQTGPVTVTATRAERPVMEVPGHVSVFDRDAIESSRARTVPELLRREPGLFVTNFTTNPAGTSVEARGFNNGGALGSSLLVLVNGRRANEADTGNTDWALIPIDAVERLEIVRGPASALYGDNAVGGVINIVTRTEPGPLRATLRGTGGSWGTGEGSLSAAGRKGPVASSLFVGGLRTDGYRDRSDYESVDLQGDVELQLGERVVLGLDGGWHRDDRQLPGALLQDDLNRLGRRAAAPTTLEDGAEVERGFAQARLEAQLGDVARLRIQPHWVGRHDDVTITFLTMTGPATVEIDTDKTSAGVDAQLQIDRSVGGAVNRLIVGGAFLYEDTDRDSSFGPLFSRNERFVYGVFLQNELSLTEKLLLSGGVRFDHADYELEASDGLTPPARVRPDFDVWSPKAALTYRVFEPLAVYASYARGFRLPNFDEDAPILPADPADPFPALKVQESDSFEIGARLESERARGSLALYHMRVENEITFDPLTFSNENFDEVRHRGLELSLAAPILAWLELYATYTLEDVEIRRYAVNPALVGNRMPITPLHRGSVGAVVELPFGLEGRAHTNVVGERYLSNDFANALPKLDAYAVLDFFLTWRAPLERWLGEAGERVQPVLHFGVRNMNDEEYFDFGADSFFGRGFNPAPTRGFEGGVSLTLRR